MTIVQELLSQVSTNPDHKIWPTVVESMVDALLHNCPFLTPGWGSWGEVAIDWLATGTVCSERYQLGDHHLATINESWAPYVPFQQYN